MLLDDNPLLSDAAAESLGESLAFNSTLEEVFVTGSRISKPWTQWLAAVMTKSKRDDREQCIAPVRVFEELVRSFGVDERCFLNHRMGFLNRDVLW